MKNYFFIDLMIPKIKIFKNKFGNPKFSYISIVVLTGSILEKKREKGISHFIEHLIFKGSQYNENIKILNNKINSKGMSINAYTSQFITCFYINTPTVYIEQAIEALIQIVFNPYFRENDIENERKVVVNELLEKANSPEHLASIHAQKIIYTNDNPLHNPVIGYIKDLAKINRDNIIEYYNSYYQPKNIIFFTSSSDNKNKIEKYWIKLYKKYGDIGKKYIETESTLKIFNEIKPLLEITGKPGLYKLTKYFPKNTSTYVLMNFVIPNLSKKEIFELDIFSNYLAGSLSSKLFLELREKKQLIYGINSSVSTGIGITNFSIEFNCKKNKKVLNECLNSIKNVFNNFFKEGIPLKEFKKFKNKTLIEYDKVKNSGLYKINSYLDKYIFDISSTNYQSIIKKITHSYFHSSIKKIFMKKPKKFIFIA